MPDLDVEVEQQPMAEVLDKLWQLYRNRGFASVSGAHDREEFNRIVIENAFQILPLAEKGLQMETMRRALTLARNNLVALGAAGRYAGDTMVRSEGDELRQQTIEHIDRVLKKS